MAVGSGKDVGKKDSSGDEKKISEELSSLKLSDVQKSSRFPINSVLKEFRESVQAFYELRKKYFELKKTPPKDLRSQDPHLKTLQVYRFALMRLISKLGEVAVFARELGTTVSVLTSDSNLSGDQLPSIDALVPGIDKENFSIKLPRLRGECSHPQSKFEPGHFEEMLNIDNYLTQMDTYFGSLVNYLGDVSEAQFESIFFRQTGSSSPIEDLQLATDELKRFREIYFTGTGKNNIDDLAMEMCYIRILNLYMGVKRRVELEEIYGGDEKPLKIMTEIFEKQPVKFKILLTSAEDLRTMLAHQFGSISQAEKISFFQNLDNMSKYLSLLSSNLQDYFVKASIPQSGSSSSSSLSGLSGSLPLSRSNSSSSSSSSSSLSGLSGSLPLSRSSSSSSSSSSSLPGVLSGPLPPPIPSSFTPSFSSQVPVQELPGLTKNQMIRLFSNIEKGQVKSVQIAIEFFGIKENIIYPETGKTLLETAGTIKNEIERENMIQAIESSIKKNQSSTGQKP